MYFLNLRRMHFVSNKKKSFYYFFVLFRGAWLFTPFIIELLSTSPFADTITNISVFSVIEYLNDVPHQESRLVFYVNGYIIIFKSQIYSSIYKSDIYINIVPSRNKKKMQYLLPSMTVQ